MCLENTARAQLLRVVLEIAARACLANTERPKSVLGYSALKITARAGFVFFDHPFKHCTGAAFSRIALDMTARACSATTGRSKARPGRTSKPLSFRSRCSTKLRGIRPHLRLSYEAPFDLALPRITSRSTSLPGSTRQPLGAPKHSTAAL